LLTSSPRTNHHTYWAWVGEIGLTIYLCVFSLPSWESISVIGLTYRRAKQSLITHNYASMPAVST